MTYVSLGVILYDNLTKYGIPKKEIRTISNEKDTITSIGKYSAF